MKWPTGPGLPPVDHASLIDPGLPRTIVTTPGTRIEETYPLPSSGAPIVAVVGFVQELDPKTRQPIWGPMAWSAAVFAPPRDLSAVECALPAFTLVPTETKAALFAALAPDLAPFVGPDGKVTVRVAPDLSRILPDPPRFTFPAVHGAGECFATVFEYTDHLSFQLTGTTAAGEVTIIEDRPLRESMTVPEWVARRSGPRLDLLASVCAAIVADGFTLNVSED